MTYTCPYCRTLFEMGGDHGVEPCAPCYKAGKRIDNCGNKFTVHVEDGPHRLQSTAGQPFGDSGKP